MTPSALARAFRSILVVSAPSAAFVACTEQRAQPSCTPEAAQASCCNNPCALACGYESPYSSLSSPCCRGTLLILEAGTVDALDGGWEGGWIVGGYLSTNPVCPALGCSFPTCLPFEDAGSWFVQCSANCTGRRPRGLVMPDRASGAPVAAYFAEVARLEAASVPAFRHLRMELLAHGAPRRLVRAAERAARDEIRHARMTASLARRYGGLPVPHRVESLPVRDLETIAVENAVEGCVRETFGALVATWQGIAAEDPLVRAAMARIARDETRHAALAFQINEWLMTRLDSSARARVRYARRLAWNDLMTRGGEVPPAIRGVLGLPSASHCRVLAEKMSAIAA